MSQSQTRDLDSWMGGIQSNESEQQRQRQVQHNQPYHGGHHEPNHLALAAIAAMGGAPHDMNLSLNMNVGNSSNNTLSLLERMVSDQQLQQQLLQHINSANAMKLISRPTEQVITISRSDWKTVLAVSETATGIDPNSILMTSLFDNIHYEDLPGIQAIQKYFWSQGLYHTKVYIRRENLEGEWIWLECNVVSTIDSPIPAIAIREARVADDAKAAKMSKLIRIAAIIATAIEEGYRYMERERQLKLASVSNPPLMDQQNEAATSAPIDHTQNNSHPLSDSLMNSVIPGLADDATALSVLLSSTDILPESDIHLRQLMEAAANGGTLPQGRYNGSGSEREGVHGTDSANEDLRRDMRSKVKSKGLDTAPSLLESMTEGPCIDISKIFNLIPQDLVLVVLVIKGLLSIEELASLISQFDDQPEAMSQHLLEMKYIADKNERNISLKTSNTKHGRNSKKRDSGGQPASSRRNSGKSLSRRESYNSQGSFETGSQENLLPLHQTLEPVMPSPITYMNLSFSTLGNEGMELLSEVLTANTKGLNIIDLSFCGIEERGLVALCRAMRKRKKKGLPCLKGLLLSGNTITYKVSKELGVALSDRRTSALAHKHKSPKEGYATEDEYGDQDDGDEDDFNGSSSRKKIPNKEKNPSSSKQNGIQLLHLASTSLTSDALFQLMVGLGETSSIQELNISSNNFGADGITLFLEFLEGGAFSQVKKSETIMPKLDRLDLSNVGLGNDGVAKLTRAISKRRKAKLIDLHLSFNVIGSGGTGTLMNKLLQQNLISLSLDNNVIGDAGCQLVAASLTSMHTLSRLNLSFNQIGSRGITSLMRGLIGSESLTYLGLSGNVVKISAAIAMGFALAQHPRLAHIEVDNCCLSQVAQCHIVAGIISNRWVPIQTLSGFQVGPPMVEIGALEVAAQHLGNTECFTMRRNIQMKTILQWMETNRAARNSGAVNKNDPVMSQKMTDFLSVDFVSNINDSNGAPSQSAYLRMLDWLSRIPFDEDELNNLRAYFYDDDDGSPDGLRGSDGNINLKVRGDLLAALDSEEATEIRDADPILFPPCASKVGMYIDDDCDPGENDIVDAWNAPKLFKPRVISEKSQLQPSGEEGTGESMQVDISRRKRALSVSAEHDVHVPNSNYTAEKEALDSSQHEHGEHKGALKDRITMFPQFLAKLDLLKAQAQDMMDNESDVTQQDIIATQFAEASLTLLRQLRYHCMNSGLDGWRQGKIRRKVLICDDSIVTRKIVGRAFEKANFIVDTAENGKEGVKMMKESIYDIAFMDIYMPVMNGFDATKALRAWEDVYRPGARQPICALTASYVDDFERSELMKFKDAGLDVMESKPCNIPRLFKVVDDVSPMFSDLSISVTQQLGSPTAAG